MTLTMWVTITVVIILAVLVIGHAIYYQRQIATMDGMMCAMATGMIIGLLVGTILGTIFKGHLMSSTVLSILIGLGVGFLSGWPISFLAMLDGMLSGLMGGMMGAMIGEMLPPSEAETLVRILFVIYAGVMIIIIQMIKKHVQPASRFSGNPFFMLILFAVFFIGYNNLGPLGLSQVAAQTGGAIEHSHSSTAPMDEMIHSEKVHVTATDFTYSPRVVQVKQGKKVTLTLSNAGNVEHDLEIQGLDSGKIHVHAKPGMSESVTFTTQRQGTYSFYCTIPGHKENGMVGKFIVR